LSICRHLGGVIPNIALAKGKSTFEGSFTYALNIF
jgi:hypothetical protein